MKVGIINVTGYAGLELARILYQHPEVTIASVTGRSLAGKKLGRGFPSPGCLRPDYHREVEGVDIIFSALPSAASAVACAPWVRKGVPVIDIAADFRLKDPQVFEQWYGQLHPAPELLERFVYGLPELHKKQIIESQVVANPGCYPTSALPGAGPRLRRGPYRRQHCGGREVGHQWGRAAALAVASASVRSTKASARTE